MVRPAMRRPAWRSSASRIPAQATLRAENRCASLLPSAEEDQQHTEQAEAGQWQCGHGLHGGVVGRGSVKEAMSLPAKSWSAPASSPGVGSV